MANLFEILALNRTNDSHENILQHGESNESKKAPNNSESLEKCQQSVRGEETVVKSQLSHTPQPCINKQPVSNVPGSNRDSDGGRGFKISGDALKNVFSMQNEDQLAVPASNARLNASSIDVDVPTQNTSTSGDNSTQLKKAPDNAPTSGNDQSSAKEKNPVNKTLDNPRSLENGPLFEDHSTVKSSKAANENGSEISEKHTRKNDTDESHVKTDNPKVVKSADEKPNQMSGIPKAATSADAVGNDNILKQTVTHNQQQNAKNKTIYNDLVPPNSESGSPKTSPSKTNQLAKGNQGNAFTVVSPFSSPKKQKRPAYDEPLPDLENLKTFVIPKKKKVPTATLR